ncbi:MAG: hypothetical protein IIC60_04820 [Proteobacteria bacterium]|nr:hypothetical protein [Pseudomonadota bacterium]
MALFLTMLPQFGFAQISDAGNPLDTDFFLDSPDATKYAVILAGRSNAVDTFLAMPDVTAEDKRKVLWDNAARLFGLDDG